MIFKNYYIQDNKVNINNYWIGQNNTYDLIKDNVQPFDKIIHLQQNDNIMDLINEVLDLYNNNEDILFLLESSNGVYYDILNRGNEFIRVSHNLTFIGDLTTTLKIGGQGTTSYWSLVPDNNYSFRFFYVKFQQLNPFIYIDNSFDINEIIEYNFYNCILMTTSSYSPINLNNHNNIKIKIINSYLESPNNDIFIQNQDNNTNIIQYNNVIYNKNLLSNIQLNSNNYIISTQFLNIEDYYNKTYQDNSININIINKGNEDVLNPDFTISDIGLFGGIFQQLKPELLQNDFIISDNLPLYITSYYKPLTLQNKEFKYINNTNEIQSITTPIYSYPIKQIQLFTEPYLEKVLSVSNDLYNDYYITIFHNENVSNEQDRQVDISIENNSDKIFTKDNFIIFINNELYTDEIIETDSTESLDSSKLYLINNKLYLPSTTTSYQILRFFNNINKQSFTYTDSNNGVYEFNNFNVGNYLIIQNDEILIPEQDYNINNNTITIINTTYKNQEIFIYSFDQSIDLYYKTGTGITINDDIEQLLFLIDNNKIITNYTKNNNTYSNSGNILFQFIQRKIDLNTVSIKIDNLDQYYEPNVYFYGLEKSNDIYYTKISKTDEPNKFIYYLSKNELKDNNNIIVKIDGYKLKNDLTIYYNIKDNNLIDDSNNSYVLFNVNNQDFVININYDNFDLSSNKTIFIIDDNYYVLQYDKTNNQFIFSDNRDSSNIKTFVFNNIFSSINTILIKYIDKQLYIFINDYNIQIINVLDLPVFQTISQIKWNKFSQDTFNISEQYLQDNTKFFIQNYLEPKSYIYLDNNINGKLNDNSFIYVSNEKPYGDIEENSEIMTIKDLDNITKYNKHFDTIFSNWNKQKISIDLQHLQSIRTILQNNLNILQNNLNNFNILKEQKYYSFEPSLKPYSKINDIAIQWDNQNEDEQSYPNKVLLKIFNVDNLYNINGEIFNNLMNNYSTNYNINDISNTILFNKFEFSNIDDYIIKNHFLYFRLYGLYDTNLIFITLSLDLTYNNNFEMDYSFNDTFSMRQYKTQIKDFKNSQVKDLIIPIYLKIKPTSMNFDLFEYNYKINLNILTS